MSRRLSAGPVVFPVVLFQWPDVDTVPSVRLLQLTRALWHRIVQNITFTELNAVLRFFLCHCQLADDEIAFCV